MGGRRFLACCFEDGEVGGGWWCPPPPLPRGALAAAAAAAAAAAGCMAPGWRPGMSARPLVSCCNLARDPCLAPWGGAP